MQPLWQAIWRQLFTFACGIVLLLATNVVQMSIPGLFRDAIDHVTNVGQNSSTMRQTLIGLAAQVAWMALLALLLRTLSRVVLLFAARDCEMWLRTRYFAHLTHLSPNFYRQHSVGDLMSRGSADLTQVRLMLGPALLNLVNAFFAYAVAIPMMLQQSWQLTLCGFAFYPPGMWLMRRQRTRLQQESYEQAEILGKLTHVVQDCLGHLPLIRSYTAYQSQMMRLQTRNQDLLAACGKQVRSRASISRFSLELTNFSQLLCLWVGCWLVQRQQLTLGKLVAVLEYLALLAWPTLAMSWMTTLWQRGLAAYQRLVEIFAQPTTFALAAAPPPTLQWPIRLQQLSLASRLKQVSIEIRSEQLIGIVGPIGSGKTTLLQVLAGLLEVAPGTLWGGDTDLSQWPASHRLAQCSYVAQTSLLFSRSLRDNVAFGVPDASDADIAAVLEMAGFAADLAAMPQKTATMIGELGINLSGGQKMRLCLARALLLHRPLLLLDDVIAAVDNVVAEHIVQTLLARRRLQTVVLASHRLAAVARADWIVVLEAGVVVAQGTHAMLLEQPGWYAAAFAEQQQEVVPA